MGAAAPHRGGSHRAPFAAPSPAAASSPQRGAVTSPELRVGPLRTAPGAWRHSCDEEQPAEEGRGRAPPESGTLCTRRVQGLARTSNSLEKNPTQTLPRACWPARDESARGVRCQVRAQCPSPPPPRHTSQLCCTQVIPGQIPATKMPTSFQFGLKRHLGEQRQTPARRYLETTLRGASESPVETPENSREQGSEQPG